MEKLQNPFLTAMAVETPLSTPVPANVWYDMPAPVQSQRGKVDRATPKTQVLRQMRAED